MATAAGLTPLLLPAFLLLLVAAHYLNLVFFAVRGLVLIGGLALIATLEARTGLSRLAAGIGLVWYAIGLDLVAVDWLQSIEPRFTSSAFGAQIIVLQLAAAVAWTILATPDNTEAPCWGDLGALLLATVLGESYLILMTLIVDWYGDQPHQAAWWLGRGTHSWLWLENAGVGCGAVLPLAALLFTGVRQNNRRLKRVAGAVLAGVLIEIVWLVAPATTAWAVLTGPLAAIGLGALLLSFARLPDASIAAARRPIDGL